ncbi:MAG: hypothetical protein FWD13_06225, partial [Treponema sp.]|nr:hypothetical protein [Treponema sp.]
MSLKIRLTAIIFAMVTVIIAILAVITITTSSSLQTETAYLYTDALAGEKGNAISRRIEAFTSYGKILSEIFNEYETTPE